MKKFMLNVIVILLLPISIPILLLNPKSRKRILDKAFEEDIDLDNIKYLDGCPDCEYQREPSICSICMPDYEFDKGGSYENEPQPEDDLPF